jgi:hypothetical protein
MIVWDGRDGASEANPFSIKCMCKPEHVSTTVHTSLHVLALITYNCGITLMACAMYCTTVHYCQCCTVVHYYVSLWYVYTKHTICVVQPKFGRTTQNSSFV